MITYCNREFPILETVDRDGIEWGKFDMFAGDKPMYLWRPTGKTAYLYTVAERPAPLRIEMSADMLKSVSHSHGVDIRVVEPCKAIVLRESVYEWRLAS